MSKKAKKIKKVAVELLDKIKDELKKMDHPFEKKHTIIILTIGYAATNAYGQYRNFKKYRALCPDRVYDRKSFEQFMEQARYRKEMSNQLRK